MFIGSYRQKLKKHPDHKFWDSVFEKDYHFSKIKDCTLDRLFSTYYSNESKLIKNCLDIGCGAGETIEELLTLGYNVTGLDFSEKALEITAQKIANLSPELFRKLKLLKVNLEDVKKIANFPRKFDLIFMKNVLSFIENRKELMSFICSNLMENGICIIINPITFKDKVYPKSIIDISIDFYQIENLLKTNFGHFRKIDEYTFIQNQINEGTTFTYLAFKKS